MYRRSLLTLTALHALAVHAQNITNCTDPWVFIDIHSRLTEGKLDFYQYGLFIGAGSPSQNMSLWPSLTSNETRLASYHFCDDSSTPECQSLTHAQFDNTTSSSWTSETTYTSLDTSTNGIAITYGTDDLHLFTHFYDPSPASVYTVPDHSIAYLSNLKSGLDPFFSSSSLGLGPSSSILNGLKKAGRIARRVVSVYVGTAYPRAGGDRNGSIVLGGFDGGRVDGPVHTYQQVSIPAPGYSPFKLHIKQVALVTADGDSIPFVTDGGFDGYLSTNQYSVEFPSSVTQLLASAIGGHATNKAENTLQASQPFLGNLTITLEDGYQIDFPSEWLTNSSNITPISAVSLNSSADSQTLFTLGAAFLHHLYLTADYEDSTFSLAQAKLYDNYVQPESLCTGQVPAAPTSTPVSKFVQFGLAGAILGGVVGFLGISFVAFWVIRKTLQTRQKKKASDWLEDGGSRGSKKLPGKSSLVKRRSCFGGISNKGKARHVVSFLTPKSSSFAAPGAERQGARLSSVEMRQTTCKSPPPTALPTSSRFEFEKTPRTATFLLAPQQKFAHISDTDDSDIPQHYFPPPPKSELVNQKIKKHSPSLSVSTKDVRRKPAPLPIRISGSNR